MTHKNKKKKLRNKTRSKNTLKLVQKEEKKMKKENFAKE